MKKIFIYYSLTGNGNLVADYLSKRKIDIRRVYLAHDMPKNRNLRILSGGFKALINYKDKLKNFNNDIDEYDEIIIGSPIWNDRLSSPINRVLSELDLTNKKVTFILYSASNHSIHASQKINELYKNAKIINLKEPNKFPEEMLETLKKSI